MKIRTAEYYVQEVFRSLRRNNWMTFAAVGTVAVSLFILGVFLILALNMNRAASLLESLVQRSWAQRFAHCRGSSPFNTSVVRRRVNAYRSASGSRNICWTRLVTRTLCPMPMR